MVTVEKLQCLMFSHVCLKHLSQYSMTHQFLTSSIKTIQKTGSKYEYEPDHADILMVAT